MAKQRNKAARVLVGTALMLAFVAVVLAVLVRQAGGWGVPWFSFTSAHGSSCTNDFTGYTCDPLTLADVEFFGDVDLPNSTVVLAGSYRATHDYQLNAQLRVPAKSAAKAFAQLADAYGGCRDDATSPLATTGLRKVCLMASADGADADGQMASRLYSVGTGVAAGGDRMIGLSIRSR